METVLQQVQTTYTADNNQVSLIRKFLNWSAEQEKNHFGWLGAIMVMHGCVITPITLFIIVLAGTNMFLFMGAIIAMGMALVTNLSAMPTKITIPVFILSIIFDIAIIISCIYLGFNFAAAFV